MGGRDLLASGAWARAVAGLGGGMVAAVVGGALHATELDAPLALGDRGPLAQIHGLPAPRAGEVLGSGETEARLSADVASHFVEVRRNGEALTLDGETRRVDLGWRAGLGDGWEIGVDVPWLQQRGGDFDGFIEGWHRFWGLPDGDRPEAPRDRLLYRYQRADRVELEHAAPQTGLGDIRLGAAYRLWRTATTDVALAATVKLPTGDADRLSGDGATATDLTLAATTQDLWGSSWTGHVNAGVIWLATGDVLAAQQRDTVWHATAGVSWPLHPRIALKAQLELRQAFYRSDLRALGGDSALLVIGGSARLGQHWLLDIGVGEDVRVDTAPDVTLQIGLRRVR